MRRQMNADKLSLGDEAKRNCKDIIVSIILSESTSSLLNLDIQNIEECAVMRQSTCIIHPITALQLPERRPTSIIDAFFGACTSSHREHPSISMEMAYFSDHFTSESPSETNCSQDSGNWEDNDEEEFEMMPYNLCPQRVFVKPLLNAKTAAHEDNIAMEQNDIVVNLIDEEDLSSVGSDLMCRICHGGESVGDLLKPCRCRGTIALAHVECLEHWLRESANSYCELCKHHFRIVRQPRYGLLWSIIMYMGSPGENFRDVILDILAFVFYTPSAIATTYMMMMICENMAKAHLNRTRNMSAHLVAICAIFGMAAIDFTYSSWLILTFQKHVISWRAWCRNNSSLRLLLPDHKRRTYSKSNAKQGNANDEGNLMDLGSSAGASA